MTVILPLTKKQRMSLKNSKYYAKKKCSIKRANFIRRLKSLATVKPHWRCMHEYGVTYKFINELKDEKWGEDQARDDFFTSLLLYCKMKDKETKRPLPLF